MYAFILRHKDTVGLTPPGILIIHETHAPVLIGSTPLSKHLLMNYSKGFRYFVFDRQMQKRKENIVSAQNLEGFLKDGALYYSFANMILEKIDFDLNNRVIEVNSISYKLEDISNGG